MAFYKVNFNLSIAFVVVVFPLNRHGNGLIVVIFLNILLLFVIPFS